MSDVMIMPSDVSEVIDLHSVSLPELPTGLAAEAMVARFVHEDREPSFAVGAFNSYI